MKILSLLLVFGIISCNTSHKLQNNAEKSDSLSISMLIDRFKVEEKQNPPRSIFRYKYKNEFVYYVPAVCCDQFSDLYDTKFKIKGHPDGGFSGMGDGLFLDFKERSYNKTLIWKDSRK